MIAFFFMPEGGVPMGFGENSRWGFLSGLLLGMDVWIHAGGLWLGLVLGDLVEGHLLPQTGDALKDVKTR